MASTQRLPLRLRAQPKQRPDAVTSENPEAATAPAVQPLVPKDAATLVLVDGLRGEPRVLMGRRHPDMAFLANKFVFPGGRVDEADLTAHPGHELPAGMTARLLAGMRGTPSPARARALAIAAIREVHEETGIVLGDPGQPPLHALTYFARAITPPDRPRRFDTRFFMADAALASVTALSGDGELSDLGWFTLDQTRQLDLPGITRLIIEDVSQALAGGRNDLVPFYHHADGRFHRELI